MGIYSLDRFITELKEMIPAVSGDVRKEYERRLKRLNDLHETVGKKGVGDANLAYHAYEASKRPFLSFP